MYKKSLVRVERWIENLRIEADAGSLDWSRGEVPAKTLRRSSQNGSKRSSGGSVSGLLEEGGGSNPRGWVRAQTGRKVAEKIAKPNTALEEEEEPSSPKLENPSTPFLSFCRCFFPFSPFIIPSPAKLCCQHAVPLAREEAREPAGPPRELFAAAWEVHHQRRSETIFFTAFSFEVPLGFSDMCCQCSSIGPLSDYDIFHGSRWIHLSKGTGIMLQSGIQKIHNWENLTSHFHVLAVELDGSRFACPLLWYYATILYFGNYYHKDPRERAGLAASAIAALVFTIAVLIAVLVIFL
ncbi:uncharacterized protein DS421_9g262920 [Arachis hypogaea]|nr:uncharacterized protein DS421_9g262920 [Arachis hypogaea]